MASRSDGPQSGGRENYATPLAQVVSEIDELGAAGWSPQRSPEGLQLSPTSRRATSTRSTGHRRRASVRPLCRPGASLHAPEPSGSRVLCAISEDERRIHGGHVAGAAASSARYILFLVNAVFPPKAMQ